MNLVKAEADARNLNDTSKNLDEKNLNSSPTATRAKANQAYYENDKLSEAAVALNNKYNYRVVDDKITPSFCQCDEHKGQCGHLY